MGHVHLLKIKFRLPLPDAFLRDKLNERIEQVILTPNSYFAFFIYYRAADAPNFVDFCDTPRLYHRSSHNHMIVIP